MMRGARSTALGFAFAAALPSAVAHAAPCEALTEGRRAFEEGARLFEAGQPADAAPRFEEAFRLACKPAAVFNAALAWEAAGDALRAARAFDQALALGLPDPQARDAEQRLSTQLAGLGTLDVRAAPGTHVTVGDQRALDVPARVRVLPGRVRVEAVFPDGTTAERQVRVSAGESRAVELAPPPPPPPPTVDRGSEFPAVPLGITALSLSGALTAATIGLGVSALSARDAFLLDRTDADLRDEAATLRTWTNVTLAGAITFAVAGAAFLVVPVLVEDDAPAPAVSLRFGPSTLALDVRF